MRFAPGPIAVGVHRFRDEWRAAAAGVPQSVLPSSPSESELPPERTQPVRGTHVVKLRLRENESINDAVRRFRKLVEHAGIKKEMRRREYYEKPSDMDRRNRRRAERRARIARLAGL